MFYFGSCCSLGRGAAACSAGPGQAGSRSTQVGKSLQSHIDAHRHSAYGDSVPENIRLDSSPLTKALGHLSRQRLQAASRRVTVWQLAFRRATLIRPAWGGLQRRGNHGLLQSRSQVSEDGASKKFHCRYAECAHLLLDPYKAGTLSTVCATTFPTPGNYNQLATGGWRHLVVIMEPGPCPATAGKGADDGEATRGGGVEKRQVAALGPPPTPIHNLDHPPPVLFAPLLLVQW